MKLFQACLWNGTDIRLRRKHRVNLPYIRINLFIQRVAFVLARCIHGNGCTKFFLDSTQMVNKVQHLLDVRLVKICHVDLGR